MRCGGVFLANAAAAPATVGGECLSNIHWLPEKAAGKDGRRDDPRARRPAVSMCNP